jgi:DNA repair protein RadC
VQDEPPPPLVLDAPDSVANAWRTLVLPNPWFDPDKEHMVVFVLNTRLVLKGWNVVSIGTANEAQCHPREVLRPVLVAAGCSFAVAHNPPSGCVSPSDADRRITARLCECAELLQIRMIDHVIVAADGNRFSFREAGMMPWTGRLP